MQNFEYGILYGSLFRRKFLYLNQKEKEIVMAQTLNEYRANQQQFPIKLCGCGCENALEENDPLGPRWVGIGADRKLINEDCYFERISNDLDKYPIGGLGIHGPGCKSPID